MKKTIFAPVLLAAALTFGPVTGCASSEGPSKKEQQQQQARAMGQQQTGDEIGELRQLMVKEGYGELTREEELRLAELKEKWGME